MEGNNTMTIDTYAANEAVLAFSRATYGITAPPADGTTTENAYTAANHAHVMFEKYLRGIDTSKYSPEGLRDVIAQFANTEPAKALDATVTGVQDVRDQAAAQVEHLKRELSPNGDVAAELRAQRYAQRTIRQLDTKDGAQLLTASNDLIRQATREELGTLIQELPAYLAARGGNSDWVDEAVTQVVPEYGRAKRRLTQAQKALDVVNYNAAQLRSRFAAETPAAYKKPILVDPRPFDPNN